jgi:hypothetical protein
MHALEVFFKYLSDTAGGLLLYVNCFVVGCFIFVYLAKMKSQRQIVYSTLKVVQSVLSTKLGPKGSGILDIWINGLQKIQDGEFTTDDGVDQFVRYIKLAAAQQGIDLTDTDVQEISTLVMTTLGVFLSNKPKQVQIAVNQFAAMNIK